MLVNSTYNVLSVYIMVETRFELYLGTMSIHNQYKCKQFYLEQTKFAIGGLNRPLLMMKSRSSDLARQECWF